MPTRACFLVAVLLPALAFAQEKPQTIEEKVKGMEKRSGLIESYLDAKNGKVLLKLPPADKSGKIGEYLYYESLSAGLGANDVGLDRGQLGNTYVIEVKLAGGKVLFQTPNFGFRADTQNPDEQRAVRESFANSILWAAKPVTTDADGSTLLDITPFIVRDAHGVSRTLRQTGQRTFRLDDNRSLLNLEGCLSFPDNLELEAVLTFTSDDPGPLVQRHTPEGESVTLIQHHSFVRLPAPGFKPRPFDPRSGYFATSYYDYAAPLDQPLIKRFIVRHRLEKTDPSAARSKAKKPIVYYVDRGTPEPVLSALREGAQWWAKAFEAAGFDDAFRVEVLPAGVHPMDVRYNVIQWTHRSTRGWSYGTSIVDPRTGEIIKGHVNLDSQRIRQDRLIFEALLGTEGTGKGGANDPIEVGIARVRQLSAHELGHTLGLAHNFAASTMGRASVMDYPHPLIRPDGKGGLDFSDAYAVGIGAWDEVAIRYGYSQFDPGADEKAALNNIIAEGLRRGLNFLSDEDARSTHGAHPLANLWDNGTDPVAELRQALQVRRIGLSKFGERNVRPGDPLGLLQESLGPLYFYHRYQIEATAKMVGGMEYSHALRGDGQIPTRPVNAERQKAALDALLDCTSPDVVTLPLSIVKLMPPHPYGYNSGETFNAEASYAFDSLAAAATASDLVMAQILNPTRCARIVELSARDATLPTLEWTLSRVIARTFPDKMPEDPRAAEIARGTQRVVAMRLMDLAEDTVPMTVRSRAEGALRSLLKSLRAKSDSKVRAEADHASTLANEIARFLNRPVGQARRAPRPPAPVPGSPIGACSCSTDPY